MNNDERDDSGRGCSSPNNDFARATVYRDDNQVFRLLSGTKENLVDFVINPPKFKINFTEPPPVSRRLPVPPAPQHPDAARGAVGGWVGASASSVLNTVGSRLLFQNVQRTSRPRSSGHVVAVPREEAARQGEALKEDDGPLVGAHLPQPVEDLEESEAGSTKQLVESCENCGTPLTGSDIPDTNWCDNCRQQIPLAELPQQLAKLYPSWSPPVVEDEDHGDNWVLEVFGTYRYRFYRAMLESYRPPIPADVKSLYKMTALTLSHNNSCIYECVRNADGLPVYLKTAPKHRCRRLPVPKADGTGYAPEADGLIMPIEAMALQYLEDVRGVVPLVDYFQTTNWCVFVFLRSSRFSDLFTFVRDMGGHLSEHIAKYILKQLVDTVLAFKVKGVVHADLKDENVIVARDTCEAQLIDFGSLEMYLPKETGKFHKRVWGTPSFLPPEDAVGQQATSDALNVYPLGVILFCMLHGKLPFTTTEDMLEAKANLQPGLTEECQDLITRCLHPDPRLRITLEEMSVHRWFRRSMPIEDMVREEMENFRNNVTCTEVIPLRELPPFRDF